jgi:hypothetical protein
LARGHTDTNARAQTHTHTHTLTHSLTHAHFKRCPFVALAGLSAHTHTYTNMHTYTKQHAHILIDTTNDVRDNIPSVVGDCGRTTR